MTIQETLEYIHSTCWKGSRPGLGRTTDCFPALAIPTWASDSSTS